MTHLQYADDIVILTGRADVSIVNMKFLLYYFEWISDQKINYYKSEVTVFGVEEDRVGDSQHIELQSEEDADEIPRFPYSLQEFVSQIFFCNSGEDEE